MSISVKTYPRRPHLGLILAVTMLPTAMQLSLQGADLTRVEFNNPGLKVDLGVGLWAWPLPMDWDGDGDLDLVVSCSDVPFRGIYLFENPEPGRKMPVFKPPVRLADGQSNIRISYVEGKPRVLTPGKEWVDLPESGFSASKPLKVAAINPGPGNTRAKQWHYVDYDGDGALDICIGIGYWGDYGWDNAFDAEGNWTRGPLHGYVYFARNLGTTAEPKYAEPARIEAGGEPLDVYGMPSPCFADYDGDGDLDLICGEFLDGFTYYQNVGSCTEPQYAKGKRLMCDGEAVHMDLQMITPTPVDWDGDGDVDLICGDEDGRVAFIEHTGRFSNGTPQFLQPKYFQQQAQYLKFGALVTPVSTDWDGDGDEDLICGNTAGYIGFIENLDGGNPPRWAAPVRLKADGRTIRIQAGPNGSIQGPCEAKWGYTTLSVADWDHDGLDDIVINSIWGKVQWYRNVGSKKEPKLAVAAPIEVQWPGEAPSPAWNWWKPAGNELATQWRTTPVVVDWDGDGLNDLLSLDHEGYLALFKRQRRGGKLVLSAGQRVFTGGSFNNRHQARGSGLLRLNDGQAGGSGRRKLCVVDFDGDGDLDLFVNSSNVSLMLNMGKKGGKWHMQDAGQLSSYRLAGHTTSPTTVDWDGDGRRDLLLGAEDGHFYYLNRSDIAEGRLDVIESSVGDVTVSGRHFEMARLDEGGKSYVNRDYVWYDVPEKLRGMRYTRTYGGQAPSITVTAKKDTVIHVASANSGKAPTGSGWKKLDDMTFGYTDKGRSKMFVYQRALQKGEQLVVPQENWSGSIVIVGKPR